LHRGCIGNPKAHDGAVRGIVIDAISEIVVTGSADKTLRRSCVSDGVFVPGKGIVLLPNFVDFMVAQVISS
jgi:hypothetical protein